MAKQSAERYISKRIKGVRKPRKKTPEWKTCSQHHFQTLLDGSILDYWPSRHKWRFKGKLWYGDVLEFIRDQNMQIEARKGQSCANCKHWKLGALGDDIWGECEPNSDGEHTHFSQASERCEKWQAAA